MNKPDRDWMHLGRALPCSCGPGCGTGKDFRANPSCVIHRYGRKVMQVMSEIRGMERERCRLIAAAMAADPPEFADMRLQASVERFDAHLMSDGRRIARMILYMIENPGKLPPAP